jgi:hypothetical protein
MAKPSVRSEATRRNAGDLACLALTGVFLQMLAPIININAVYYYYKSTM